jgi:hypothetical protein
MQSSPPPSWRSTKNSGTGSFFSYLKGKCHEARQAELAAAKLEVDKELRYR